ncbi:MAG: tetratricopeptide repeat protein [Verrucomicrobiota bacterium]
MKNFGLILLIVGFFLLVTVGVFSAVASFLNREFVDIYRMPPPPTFEQMIVADENFAEMERWQVEDAYAMELRTGDAAKAMSDFEAGWEKSRSEDRAVLLEAREHLQRVVSEYQDDELTPKATLYLGRVLVKLEDWPAAKEALVMINKNKDWLDKLGRAESNFLYGLCLEKLGKTDDAIKVYNAVIAVYGEYSEWSLQALERGFEIAYSSDDPEMKLKSYRYMKKLLYMFQNFGDAPGSGGSLERLYERRDTVKVELGITEEQEREIDRKLGISWERLDRKGSIVWVFNIAIWVLLLLTGVMTVSSARKTTTRFWRYALALFLVSLMAGLVYWANVEAVEVVHRQQRAISGIYSSPRDFVIDGQIYYMKLSLIFQSALGFFVMMMALLLRKVKSQ